MENHLELLHRVLQKLNYHKLQVNREKSEFCPQGKYLGYIVDKLGLRTDPEKVAPVLEYPPPEPVRSFLGMVGWYGRFIPTLAEIKLPLTALLKKDVKWQWGPEQQQAFEILRIKLTQAPVLARPTQNKPYILQTDASHSALGAVLCQDLDGEEHPIAYASRTLSKPY